MRNFKSLFITSASIVCLGACTQAARNDIEPMKDSQLPVELPSTLTQRLEKYPETETKKIIRVFERITKNDRIEKSQIQDRFNQQITQRRLSILSNLLAVDKNANGDITAKEMLSIANSQVILWQKGTQDYIPYDEADTNLDNIISLNESFVFAQKYAQILGPIKNNYDVYLMMFDSNKDGTLTREELNTELESFNSNIKASPKTNTAPQSNLNKKSQSPPKVCIPSHADTKDEVIFISGYGGSGLSSVAVTGMDRTTEFARLVIEKGETPLYIVASSHTSMIWSIEGDTQRVKKFVTSRNRHKTGAGVGVIGLPKSKIEFLGRNCLNYFTGQQQSKAILAKSKWGKLVGKAPDYTVGANTIHSMKLPSGENASKKTSKLRIISGNTEIQLSKNSIVIPRQNHSNKDDDYDLYRYTIEGLITIDPNTVIAPEPVQTYDVFPQEAGIVQLVKAGKLIPLERGSFKIEKPIARFPAGLAGAHSVKFILGENVPMPKGNYGHSSVYSAATGECLSKHCR